MMKKLVLSFLKNRLKELEKYRKMYNHFLDFNEITAYQLEFINKILPKLRGYPIYKDWNLPKKISSLEELKELPKLTKRELKENFEVVLKKFPNYSGIIATGGSTGEPVKLPVSKEEMDRKWVLAYLYRSWWGIEPFDKMSLFWGHSHLFGSGIKGRIKFYIRKFQDFLLNTKRFNAYNLTEEEFWRTYKYILNKNPKVFLGYTSAILKFCKFLLNEDKIIDKKIKIILTAESVEDDDIIIIKTVFPYADIIIEYGMVETGVIAASFKNIWNLKVLWSDFIVTKDENGELLVTTIGERLFPLLNYKTGDFVEDDIGINGSILGFKRVEGRRNDDLLLKINGKIVSVHSEFFTHILKNISEVLDFRIVQKKDSKIHIYVKFSPKKGNLEKIKTIFLNELKKEFPKFDVNQFMFLKGSELPLTKAGKTKWIRREWNGKS